MDGAVANTDSQSIPKQPSFTILALHTDLSPTLAPLTLQTSTLVAIPGTIFGVYLADPSKSARENALQPGNRLVAGGYCLYSSSTVRGDESFTQVPGCLFARNFIGMCVRC